MIRERERTQNKQFTNKQIRSENCHKYNCLHKQTESKNYRNGSGPKNTAQKVSGHKVSKIDNIGKNVSSQNYLNEDNEHYIFSY